uniref:Uncharacterized protein n=1 Tax=Hordeum vulgare subsp. vulgare TaxID=112509 RepID=A0A8I6Z4X3_HORVV
MKTTHETLMQQRYMYPGRNKLYTTTRRKKNIVSNTLVKSTDMCSSFWFRLRIGERPVRYRCKINTSVFDCNESKHGLRLE